MIAGTESVRFDPFDALANEHGQFTRSFAHHQEALLDRDWLAAAGLLEAYREQLYRHMDIEERFVLGPAPAEALAAERWTAEVYRAEHRRIRLFLEPIGEWLVRARQNGAPAGMLIGLLDRERTLKHLLEHHHHREEVALFTHMRSSLSPRQQASLGEALARPARSVP